MDILELYNAGASYYAIWSPSTTPDRISLNHATMQNLSYSNQYSTILHEFGHALGFNDIYDKTYRTTSLMYNDASDYIWFYTPQSHDYEDYENSWYYYP